MEFGYNISNKGNYIVVSLKGDLIEKNQANDLMEEIGRLADNKENNFVINLGDFRYMNSTGLNVMLGILARARKNGGEAVICSVPEKIKTLLVITKLVNVFSVVDTEEEAARVFTAV